MNKDGMVVGYTDDGFVFISSDTTTPDGKPMQVHMIFAPDKARLMAKELLQAADACYDRSRVRLIQ